MSATSRISGTEHLALATAGGNDQWELFDGEARRKPGMSAAHNALMAELAFMLRSQLDPARSRVGVNSARIRGTERNLFIRDIVAIPASAVLERIARPDLERYDAPMPQIVESWSPSTGEYDLDVKLAAYQARGDAEIWRIRPASA